MTLNIEQLKAAALAVTPVDMDLYGDRYSQGCWSRADFDRDQDAFYRAANPAAVLELIADIERLRSMQGSTEPVAWYCPASGGFWLSEESIPAHIKALGVEALAKISPPSTDALTTKGAP